jgi:hypothetical protein
MILGSIWFAAQTCQHHIWLVKSMVIVLPNFWLLNLLHGKFWSQTKQAALGLTWLVGSGS